MILLLIVSLLLCVILHELGHLFTALYCGCGVEKIGIGFGKSLYSFNIKNIRVEINPILLGGFVKLKHETQYSMEKNSFTNLPYRKKLLIAYAGILVNLISGIIALGIGLYLQIWNIYYFGFISTILGVTNSLPIPALDGSYPFLVLLEKIYGKPKGYAIMDKLCKWGFRILMITNILCIPYVITHWKQFQF